MSQEEGPCAYCGTKTSSQDAYGLACKVCVKYFQENPTPPIAPPTGTVLVNLSIKKEKGKGK